MAPRACYIPLLKGKEGEFVALGRLKPEDRIGLLPMIDIPKVDMDWEMGEPKYSLDVHFDRRSKRIRRSWGASPVIVDIFDIPLDERTTDGQHPVAYLHGRLRHDGVAAIPTTGFDRDAEFNEAIKKVILHDSRGLCIRLTPEDIDLHHQLRSKIDEFLRDMEVSARDCHVILDLRSLIAGNVSEEAVDHALGALGRMLEWRTVSLAGSGMPHVVSDVLDAGHSCHLARPEIEIWKRTRRQHAGLIYGDYGTVHPELIYQDPRVLARNMGPNIKYTLESEWILIRGYPFKTHPERWKQYYSLARDLVARPQFKGPDYSCGDWYAVEKAQERGGTGNPTSWVAMSTNHHLTLVRKQIAQSVR